MCNDKNIDKSLYNVYNIIIKNICNERWMIVIMKEECDIKNQNPEKNPHTKKLKKQISINIDNDTIDYFKSVSEDLGIPYQTLINLYLSDCAKNKKKLQLTWE